MNFLTQAVGRTAEYKKLLGCVKRGTLPVEASGLADIHKALIVAALIYDTNRKGIVLLPDEGQATTLSEDLSALGVKSLLLPSRDLLLSNITASSKEYERLRADTLSALSDGAFDVVCLSAESATQFVPKRKNLSDKNIKLAVGDTASPTLLAEKLLSSGYLRCEMVEAAGQFAARGGIVDIFPVCADTPCRIEFWGDEVDTISEFDIYTQRRTTSKESVDITPAGETVTDKDILRAKLEQLLEKDNLSDKRRAVLRADIDALSAGVNFPLDRYIPLIYENTTVFDYVENPLIFTADIVTLKDRLSAVSFRRNEDIKNYLEEGLLCSATANLYLDEADLMAYCAQGILLDNFVPSSVSFPLKELLSFDYKRNSPWSGDMTVLKEDIGYALQKGGLVVVAAGSERAAQRLFEEVEKSGIHAMLLIDVKGLPERGVVITVGGMSSGFELPETHFMFITHRHIAPDRKQKRARANKNAYNSLEELKLGDYVVHSSHGIGIFDGINRITANGITKDYIKIKYAKGDILYVPVTQLDLVSKYIGAAEEGTIRLNRLGGSEWSKTRKRVRAAVKDMAKQLTALYAKRMSIKGHAFSPDTDLQSDFERRFEFEETEDQLRSINEIKNDMERPVPMDRLLCGDVGFGKTEVALRAAFKCISEGKQCAILVPTTILAWQHYNTIVKRFGELPLEVRMLSRFVSAREQQKTVAGLRRGNIDLVVGTHRLISKDISFHDLGLVIIDEEQRFGVAQKEKLKETYPAVDVLTLSATPIPRTLNMAMSGLRDLSSIDEAPEDRHPVQTYVLEQNNAVLLEAIRKELRRAGQVYYLHNRVDTIERTALRIREAIPEAQVAVAHGKMSEEELSSVWKRLLEHEIDILVCTTIIETGVDVPNANTLIIEDADRFGLSQLHQLRGRVGRSTRRAYAYFCYRYGKGLSETATKRLDAIREYTEFGSGFKIAMRDLEIRGAGSILGGSQSGNMEAVGYDMYLKLLNSAMREEKGEEQREENDCLVDLAVPAHIPENYIESLPARLSIYRRIAEIKSSDDASDVIDELCDRFGEPPSSVIGLIDIALFRSRASAVGIYEITEQGSGLCIKVNEIKEDLVAKLCDSLGNRVYLVPTDTPYFNVKKKQGQKTLDALKEIAEIL